MDGRSVFVILKDALKLSGCSPPKLLNGCGLSFMSRVPVLKPLVTRCRLAFSFFTFFSTIMFSSFTSIISSEIPLIKNMIIKISSKEHTGRV